MKFTFLIAAAALAAGLAHAPAQAQSARSGALMQSCGADLRAHCAGVTPGGGRVLACLQKNEAQLTAACKAQLQPMAQCRQEAVALCGDVAPPALRECFAAKREQFSAACRELGPAH